MMKFLGGVLQEALSERNLKLLEPQERLANPFQPDGVQSLILHGSWDVELMFETSISVWLICHSTNLVMLRDKMSVFKFLQFAAFKTFVLLGV